MNTLENLAQAAVEGSKESWRMLIEQFAMPWARNAAFHWLRRSNCRMPDADFADITHDAVLESCWNMGLGCLMARYGKLLFA